MHSATKATKSLSHEATKVVSVFLVPAKDSLRVLRAFVAGSSCASWFVWLSVLIVCLPAPVVAQTLNDFARGAEIRADEGGTIFRVLLPDDVYDTTTRTDLADLRVVNAAGESVPHALRPTPRPSADTEWRAGPSFPFFFMRTASGRPRGDKRFRQPIAWALARAEIVKLVYYGSHVVTAEPTPEPSPWATGVNAHKGGPDLAKAKQLMSEAGVGGGLNLTYLVKSQVPVLVKTGEILREGSGLLARDIKKLGDALGRLLGDAALRRTTAERARERARAFAPETLIPRYEDAYRKLIQ